MNEKRKRVVKTIYAFSVVLLALFVSVSSSFFVSNAADNLYYIDMQQPICTGKNGYIELLLRSKSDTSFYMVMVIYWNCFGSSSNPCVEVNVDSSRCDLTLTSGDYFTVLYQTSDGRDTVGIFGSGKDENYFYNPGSYYTIESYRVYGNYSNVYSGIGGYKVDWDVMYNESSVINTQLVKIYNELVEANYNDTEMLKKINSIMTSTASIEDKLDRLIELQEDSNEWLEKIFNKISEMLDLEGEESTEPLPDEEVDSVLQGESNLMQDTTSAENNLNFSVDSNSNNVVWNIIERVLNSNARVFGAFIGIMTLGVVTLLLNR